MSPHTRSELLVQLLERRFARIKETGSPREHFNAWLHGAIVDYARTFAAEPELLAILDELRAQRDELGRESEQMLPDVAQRVRSTAVRVIDLIDGAEGGDPEKISYWTTLCGLHAAARFPLLWVDDMPAHLSNAKPMIPAGTKDELATMEKAAEEDKTRAADAGSQLRARLAIGTGRFAALDLVQLIVDLPEGLTGTAPTSFEGRRARACALELNSTGLRWGKFVPGIANSVTTYQALASLHDEVCIRLLGAGTRWTNLLRFGERCTRFDRENLLRIIEGREPKPGNSKDEEEFKRQLNLYLHDRGFNPLPEVVAGNARADGLIPGRTSRRDVVYEAKVVRPEDDVRHARAQVKKGLKQASRYARNLGTPWCFLVLIWASPAGHQLPTEVSLGHAMLKILVVDLRDPPSRSTNGETLSMTSEEVVAAAAG